MITDGKPGMIAVHCRRSYIVLYGYRLPHLRLMQFHWFSCSVGSSACSDPEFKLCTGSYSSNLYNRSKTLAVAGKKSEHLLNKQ